MGICVTDSLCCTPETNTTLLTKYTPIKIFQNKKQTTEILLLLLFVHSFMSSVTGELSVCQALSLVLGV